MYITPVICFQLCDLGCKFSLLYQHHLLNFTSGQLKFMSKDSGGRPWTNPKFSSLGEKVLYTYEYTIKLLFLVADYSVIFWFSSSVHAV